MEWIGHNHMTRSELGVDLLQPLPLAELEMYQVHLSMHDVIEF